ncbi:hypothetical protein K402DRAFT_389239 [Aulographum hederae CBS 113979]|uniref:Uncharacterized protein n=1 Tax=Aulographum hederae CBS 113979 TaxID=1176131 RepID=A0A6G1HD96_9PEZI|nr:hypothetical protein K402DRAFT_389239 [Aulographum hederae CBS 113979]
MNIKTTVNPYTLGYYLGRVNIALDQGWAPAPSHNDTKESDWPLPTIRDKSLLVLVASGYMGRNCDDVFKNQNPILGNISTLYNYPDSLGSCPLLARLNFTAGVANCRDCPIVSDGVVELAGDQAKFAEVLPDPLVDTAIAMMPEVLHYLQILNVSYASEMNNIDGYTRGMLSLAYQTSWGALAADLGMEVQVEETGFKTPFAVLLAKVTVWRVIVWYVGQLLLTLTGLVIAAAEWKSKLRMERKPLSMLLILGVDASNKGERDQEGGSDVACPCVADEEVRLSLVVPEEDELGCQKVRLEVSSEVKDDSARKGKVRIEEWDLKNGRTWDVRIRWERLINNSQILTPPGPLRNYSHI